MSMETFADIILRWDSMVEFGADLDSGTSNETPYQTIAGWRRRNFIPSYRWADLLRAAARRGHHDITIEKLGAMAARRERKSRTKRVGGSRQPSRRPAA